MCGDNCGVVIDNIFTKKIQQNLKKNPKINCNKVMCANNLIKLW